MSNTGTQPLTQLEAVNMMLEAVFEAPVNSLDALGVQDVAIAQRLLSVTVRQALLRGVANNVEYDVALTPDVTTGKIPLPNNVLRVDPMADDGAEAVQRGGFLYDRENHTFVWTRAVKVEIYYHLEWDDLAEHIKYACAVRAARRFQKHVLGDSDKGGFDADEEKHANALLLEADTDISDDNATTDNWSVYSILER